MQEITYRNKVHTHTGESAALCGPTKEDNMCRESQRVPFLGVNRLRAMHTQGLRLLWPWNDQCRASCITIQGTDEP